MQKTTKNALIISVAGLLFLGAAGTVYAANESKPGDALHGLDLAMENAQRALTNNPAKKAELETDIAEERIDELIALEEELTDKEQRKADKEREKDEKKTPPGQAKKDDGDTGEEEPPAEEPGEEPPAEEPSEEPPAEEPPAEEPPAEEPPAEEPPAEEPPAEEPPAEEPPAEEPPAEEPPAEEPTEEPPAEEPTEEPSTEPGGEQPEEPEEEEPTTGDEYDTWVPGEPLPEKLTAEQRTLFEELEQIAADIDELNEAIDTSIEEVDEQVGRVENTIGTAADDFVEGRTSEGDRCIVLGLVFEKMNNQVTLLDEIGQKMEDRDYTEASTSLFEISDRYGTVREDTVNMMVEE